jgi:serine/threonine protein kinase/CheY-like chemotaxis protein
MAEIYLARKEGYSGFAKLLALKKILPRYSQNPAFARMLIHEAKLAARLQHFNVVQVHDLGEIDGQVYIAMEYVRGRDLAALLSHAYRREERLPLALSLCIATEFLTGLDYAHRLESDDGRPAGLIHRDISPQNVLISYEGEVKLTDFGIARVLFEKEAAQIPPNLHGKFGYMSPEQVVGKPLDQRSDVFSAGVVLHEMLTSQRLFRGKTPRNTIESILNDPIDPPSTINPEVPEEVDRVCLKALERDRDLRYRTVGALLGDLSRIADALPERAQRRDLAVYMRRQFRHLLGRASSGTSVSVPPPGARLPLGEILIQSGALTSEELEIGLAAQRARGGRIGEVLLQSGAIDEEDLVEAIARQSTLDAISSGALDAWSADGRLLARFPREVAEATLAVPLGTQGDRVRLAVVDPFDARAILEAKVVLGLGEVSLAVAGRTAVRSAISRWYPDDAATQKIPTGSEERVVLIADQDPAMAEVLARRIRDEECTVLVASEGRAARDLGRKRRPIVAFLDATLPGVDGYNLLLDLRSRDRDAAVFITSARADAFHQSKALELGADDFIGKPWDLEVVTAKLRREIQRRRRAPAFHEAPPRLAPRL